MTSNAQIYNVLIAESFSCQRDILIHLKESWLRPHLQIFACHSIARAEILQNADHILPLMPKGDEAIDWLYQQCIEHDIHLVFIGKYSQRFEAQRARFEAQGIILVTGAIGVEQHQIINNKYDFTLKCQAQNLPIIPAYQFTTVAEFLQCHQLAAQQHPQHKLCAKPVHGVFAYGFIRFEANANFNGLFAVPLEINIKDFCEQYARLDTPPAYILMPYLTGQECSVDIACHQGKIISMAMRLKEGHRQQIRLNGECDALCHQLVELFDLDGLINIQFKQNEDQQWHILEINARPAGGFSYSIHTGLNLIADLVAYKLHLNNKSPASFIDEIYVYPFTSSLSETL